MALRLCVLAYNLRQQVECIGLMETPSDGRQSPAFYPTTDWGQISAAKGKDDAAAEAALASLCERYYPAIISYFRRKLRDTNAAENAEDLAQSFVATRLIAGNALEYCS